jgi:hypothetical protein
MKASLRRFVATLVGSVTLSIAPAAFAAGEACLNDTDCPGAMCGGEVCNWNKPLPMPLADPNKPYTCNAAGTDPKGSDGWCSNTTTHEHCKCKAEGAKCVSVWCSFTKPDQAPAGSGGTGAGGTGTAGTGTAGTGTAGTGTAGTGTTTPPPAEGGCSISIPGRTSTGIALGLGAAGLALALLRRRR